MCAILLKYVILFILADYENTLDAMHLASCIPSHLRSMRLRRTIIN